MVSRVVEGAKCACFMRYGGLSVCKVLSLGLDHLVPIMGWLWVGGGWVYGWIDQMWASVCTGPFMGGF